MKKKSLYITDIILSLMLIFVLTSSILNEVLGGSPLGCISNKNVTLFHIIVCLILMSLAFIHIKAHYGNFSRWRNCLKKGKMQNRVIFVLSTITLLSGIAATVLFFYHGHTPLGGIHGKVGLAAITFMLFHLAKRLSNLKALKR